MEKNPSRPITNQSNVKGPKKKKKKFKDQRVKSLRDHKKNEINVRKNNESPYRLHCFIDA